MAEIDDRKTAVTNQFIKLGFGSRLIPPRGMPSSITPDDVNQMSAARVTELLNRMGGWVH